ncbi:hypothetical protein NBRC116602_22640 [Hyphomicrobiales bacterium 4NK60-0047b]
MTDPSYSKDRKPFTGKHMLIVMLSFFGVIIAVNLTMATLATSSWTGLVVKNGYIASQHFNKNQEVQEKLVAAGWRSELEYSDGVFVLSLSKNSKSLVNCQVSGLLSRPVHENENQVLSFKYSNTGTSTYSMTGQKKTGGQYIAPIKEVSQGQAHEQSKSPLKPGRWNLEVQALCPPAETGSSHETNDKFIQTYKFLAPELSSAK